MASPGAGPTGSTRFVAYSGAPPGWSINPSMWSQRIPILALATVGFSAATWLALYQHGIVDTVWEPFFGDGTDLIVIESEFSRFFERWPIRDAGIGALVYAADGIAGAVGGSHRWRTMPWIVFVFGILIGPLGAVSVILTIIQPVLYDAFCTLCLVSGAASLMMIGPAMDEVLASLQQVKRERQAGRSIWLALRGTVQ